MAKSPAAKKSAAKKSAVHKPAAAKTLSKSAVKSAAKKIAKPFAIAEHEGKRRLVRNDYNAHGEVAAQTIITHKNVDRVCEGTLSPMALDKLAEDHKLDVE